MLAAVAADLVGIVFADDLEPARSHFGALGVSVKSVSTPTDLDEVNFAYLLHADPATLIETLGASGMWDALTSRWSEGMALATSGGASSAICAFYLEAGALDPEPGLALIPDVALMHHADFGGLKRREDTQARIPAGIKFFGLEHETTAIFADGQWTAFGPGTVNYYFEGAERDYGPADQIPELPHPAVL